MKVYITTDEQSNKFLLTPIDFRFESLRGLGMYVKNINSGELNDGVITIPFTNSDINQVYSKIIDLFENRFGCVIMPDSGASAVIKKAQEERENFQLFSERAFEIRNNNIDKEELEELIGILDSKQFVRTLKPFQLLSAYHLAFSQNACNFSVPGSGKTTTVLAAYELLRKINDPLKQVNKLLVVGPLSSFFAWKNEYKECFGRNPKYIEIRGGVSANYIENKLLRSNVREELILISYWSLESKLDLIHNFLNKNRVMVVLDEAHRIKNTEDGVHSKAALSLSEYASSRVILTGTPAANSYVDLYNLFKFIWPVNNIIGYSTMQLRDIGIRENDFRVQDLINRISPFYIRIKKSDLDLPSPIHHAPQIIEMSIIQRIIYDAIAEMTVRSYEQSDFSTVFKKSAFIRLRQAASNPKLLNKPIDKYFYEEIEAEHSDDTLVVDDKIIELIKNYEETPGKFIAAHNLVNQVIMRDEKIIIWCEFIGTCDDLSKYLIKKGIFNAVLYGGTPQEEREKIIIEFHNNPELKVVIANPYAVGESISLHKTCHNALYLEQGYNAGVYMQSKDRIHRVGLNEEDKIEYFYFHSEDSVDNLAYKRVMLKESKMLDIIESEEIPLISDNKDFMEDMEDDIKAIMREYYERKRVSI